MTIGSDIEIKNPAGVVLLTTGFSNSDSRKREIMKENSLMLTFNLATPIDFPLGSYVEYEGEKLSLLTIQPPQEVSLQEYHYELVFETPEMRFRDFILFYPRQDLLESNWSLTSDPASFMIIAIDNIRRAFNDNSWNVGTVEPDEIMSISFSDINIFDGLTQIAETYEAEWYVTGKTLHLLNKVIYGAEVELKRGVQISEIERNEGESQLITRLYPFGSTRNLEYNYRGTDLVVDGIVQRRLRIPANKGNYIDVRPGLNPEEIIEGVKIFEEVYPKRVGTITAIREGETTPNDAGETDIVFYFKDSGLTFLTDYILPGETLKVRFVSGDLNGRDFDLGFDEEQQEFEIINEELSDYLTLPNETLKPRIGDEYVLYNFDIKMVGSTYVPAAEQELYDEAVRWLEYNSKDTDIYNCTTNPIRCRKDDIDLEVGQKVSLKSILFKDGVRNSRILGYEKNLYEPYKCTYIVGDNSKYSRIENIERSINQIQYAEKIYTNGVTGGSGGGVYLIKEYDNSTPTDFNTFSAKRIKRDYLRKNAEDTAAELITFDKGLHVGDFTEGFLGGGAAINIDEDGVTTVETDKLIVRKYAKFFELIIERLSHIGGQLILSPARMECVEVEEFPSYYRCYFDTGENNEFVQEFVAGDQARCQVFTGSGTKYYWRLVTLTGTNFIDLSKTDFDAGSDIPEAGDKIVQLGNRNNLERQNAQILSSFGEDAPSYKQYEKINSYSLYQKEVTIISPSGNKFTGKFTASDGVNFIDFITTAFHLGNANTFIDFDPTANSGAGKFTVRGIISQSQSGDEFPIGTPRGVYNPVVTYFKGDSVTYNGSTYMYINDVSSSGNVPTNTGYWTVIASRGADGQSGSYKGFVFKQSYTQPDTPTGTNIIPTGWLDAPVGTTNSITDISHVGTWTLQSDGMRKSPAIGNSAITKSRINFTTTKENQIISIYLKVSSESGFDFGLVGLLDNSNLTISTNYTDRISGETEKSITINVANAGAHFIEVAYAKDSSSVAGSDCCFYRFAEDFPWWMSTSLISFTDGSWKAGTWSSPVKVTGEDGEPGLDGKYWDYRYAVSENQPAVPSGLNPTGWSNTPPEVTSGKYLWMSFCEKNADQTQILQDWSSPVRISGEDGRSPYYLDLTNENASIACDYNGNAVGVMPSCVVNVYTGSSILSGVTFKYVVSGCVINISTGVYVSTNSFQLTTISVDNATVTVTARMGVTDIGTATMNISKVRAGSPGENAVVYWIEPSVSAIQRDKDGVTTPSTISCVKMKQIGGQTATTTTEKTLRYKLSNGVETNYSGSISVSSTSVVWIDFILYDGAIVLDRERVPVVSDGTDGANGENGTGGKYTEYRFAKSASTTAYPTPFNPKYNNPNYPNTGESPYSVSMPSLGALEYLWMTKVEKDYKGDILQDWSTPIRFSPVDGQNGQKGSSPALVYRGIYNQNPNGTTATLTYYGNEYRVDAVKYGSTYYVARIDAGTFSSILPTNTAKWNPFGASFESIATGLLLAEMANIGDWIIKNKMIVSPLDYNGNTISSENMLDANLRLLSKALLNGNTGDIMFNNKDTLGNKQSVYIGGSQGVLHCEISNAIGSGLNCDGIGVVGKGISSVPNGFGGNTIPGLTKDSKNSSDSRTALFAIADGNVASGTGFLAGIYARATNRSGGRAIGVRGDVDVTSDATPTSNVGDKFGGYFDNLRANGLYLGMKVVTDNELTTGTNYTTIGNGVTYLLFLNESRTTTIIIGKPEYQGRMAYIKRAGSGAVALRAYDSTTPIYTNSNIGITTLNIQNGELYMVLFYNDVWYVNKMGV
jgi:hypothetical protein